MAFASLGIVPPRRAAALSATQYVTKAVAESKRSALAEFNTLPGVEYFFDDLRLRRVIKDEGLLRTAYRQIGMDEPTIDVEIQLIRDDAIAVDYGVFDTRIRYYKWIFDGITAGRHRSAKVPVALTFDTLFDAGATAVNSTEAAILISAGLYNFERWFFLRQLFEEQFDVFGDAESFRGTDDKLPVLRRTVEALHVYAVTMLQSRSTLRSATSSRAVAGKPRPERVVSASQAMAEFAAKAGPVLNFMTYVEQALRDPDAQQLERKRSEYIAAEIFILCHEFGHVNLGHLEEIGSWYAAVPKSEAEMSQRIMRRRQMEHEADRYAVAGMVRVLSHIRGREVQSVPDAFLHPDARRDFLLPVVDLFTILELGQRGFIDFTQSDCSYPSNRMRLRDLLPTDATHEAVESFMLQLTWLADVWMPTFE